MIDSAYMFKFKNSLKHWKILENCNFNSMHISNTVDQVSGWAIYRINGEKSKLHKGISVHL